MAVIRHEVSQIAFWAAFLDGDVTFPLVLDRPSRAARSWGKKRAAPIGRRLRRGEANAEDVLA
jgi:hypothetical protein